MVEGSDTSTNVAVGQKAVFSLLLSTAPAERVFSLLKAHTNNLQTHTLEDHLETALTLQFNSGHSTACSAMRVSDLHGA